MPSLPDPPDIHHLHRPGVAAELLPPPWPGAPTCACCTPDPTRRAALDRLRAQHHHLAVARAAERLMPTRGCCRSRGRAA
jgi:hypothetical protein